ncbi:GNAT family N-acetyltransferase [Halovenus rubra]|uniref:GNAT family N-acetyltransferase n=2 Tax=Halovenus rubra TaxID=869890 RepID=A0ACC7E1Y9_9EURY|nr:GNAT family N-acetyltransferase [Halovenus rubra]
MSEYEIRRIPGDGELSDAYDVRRDVFIQEQNVSEAEEWDGNDEDAVHYVVYNDGYPIGTARVRIPEAHLAKIERVAVRKQYRQAGIGQLLMETLETEVRDQNATEVLLHAQTAVKQFYEKLGYMATSDHFNEAGISHVKMTKRLD